MSERNTPEPIRSQSGRRYGARALGKTAYQHAQEGIRDSEHEKYEVVVAEAKHYIFTITDLEDNREFSLFIGAGPHDNFSVPRCYCGNNKENIACKHIFWLWDQIFKTAFEALAQPPKETSWHFLQDGRLQGEGRDNERYTESLNGIIEAMGQNDGFGKLLKKRGWTRGRVEEIRNADFVDRVKKLTWAIRPSAGLKGFFAQTNPQRTKDVGTVVIDRFVKIIEDYARLDARFQESLDQLLHPEFTNSVELAQMMISADDCFESINQSMPSDQEVEVCAKKFRVLIIEINEFWTTKPLAEHHRRCVAGLHTSIFKGVIGSSLFVPLITKPQPSGTWFMLEELGALPVDFLREYCLETLKEMDRELSTKGGADQYRAELNGILAHVHGP